MENGTWAQPRRTDRTRSNNGRIWLSLGRHVSRREIASICATSYRCFIIDGVLCAESYVLRTKYVFSYRFSLHGSTWSRGIMRRELYRTQSSPWNYAVVSHFYWCSNHQSGINLVKISTRGASDYWELFFHERRYVVVVLRWLLDWRSCWLIDSFINFAMAHENGFKYAPPLFPIIMAHWYSRVYSKFNAFDFKKLERVLVSHFRRDEVRSYSSLDRLLDWSHWLRKAAFFPFFLFLDYYCTSWFRLRAVSKFWTKHIYLLFSSSTAIT